MSDYDPPTYSELLDQLNTAHRTIHRMLWSVEQSLMSREGVSQWPVKEMLAVSKSLAPLERRYWCAMMAREFLDLREEIRQLKEASDDNRNNQDKRNM